jgi:5'-nucleotidase / UDP-sugar diphosphatase
MRVAANADITIVNAGSIRGDRVFPAGALTRRTVIEMHPFGGVICKVAVPGRIVLQALNSGVSKLPATAGQFPQVSGLTMRVATSAPVDRRVSDVRVGGQPLELDKTYTVAVTDYMLMGGDNYAMFTNQPVLIGPEAGDLIVTALEKYMAERHDIAPVVDGRIAITR